MQRRRFISALSLSAAAPLLRAQEPLPARLGFGLITPRNPEATYRAWGPFIERMGAAAGVEIQPRTYAATADLLRDFVRGELHLGWVGNAAALEIVESGTGSLFATKLVNGRAAYRSTLIVHRDSPLRSIDDVHRQAGSLVFGDGEAKSTSGHLVPRYFAFAKKGVNEPEKAFREVRAGSHEKNLLAVASREVDVATNNTTEIETLRITRPQEAALIRVIWESPDIPESPLVWRNDLAPALKRRIAAFAFDFGAASAEEKSILWNLDRTTAFRRTSNRQLVAIADLEMFIARQQIMNDASLSQAERLARVDAAVRRGSKLELMLKASS